jgi:hypothetical protein
MIILNFLNNKFSPFLRMYSTTFPADKIISGKSNAFSDKLKSLQHVIIDGENMKCVILFACNKIKLVSSSLVTNFLKINAPVLQNQTTDGGDMNIEDEERF